jgi:hypothetical protein
MQKHTKPTQKKSYRTPKLAVYGNVEKITQASGFVSATDVLWFAGQATNHDTHGSSDIRLG